jgi:hypothetical protein
MIYMTPALRRLLLDSPGFNPYLQPNTAARYDISDLSSLIYDGSNRVSLVADKSGNSSVNVLALNGASGNTATSPNSAAIQLTANLDLRCQAQLAAWSTASNFTFISKMVTAGQRQYILQRNGFGGLSINFSTDGTAQTNINGTVPIPLSAYQVAWVRATLVVATGVAVFYTSVDGINWTQYDTVTAGAVAIFSGTSSLQIGDTSIASNIYRAQIYNGIAGTLVFDANFATFSKLAATGTESSANAATVTINSSGDLGARICGARDLVNLTVANQPVLTISGSGNFLTTNGTSQYMKTAAFLLSQPVTCYGVISQPTWSINEVLFDGITPTVQITQLTGTPRLGIPGGSSDVFIDTFATGVTGVLSWGWNGASSFIRRNRDTADTGTGPSTAPNGLTISANGSGAAISNLTFFEIIIRNVADNQSLQDRIINFLIRKHRITA